MMASPLPKYKVAIAGSVTNKQIWLLRCPAVQKGGKLTVTLSGKPFGAGRSCVLES